MFSSKPLKFQIHSLTIDYLDTNPTAILSQYICMWKHPSRCGYRSLRHFKAWTTRLYDALWLISCDELLFFTETTETTQSWARDMGFCEMSQPPKRPSFRCFDRFKFCSRVLGKSMILHDIIWYCTIPWWSTILIHKDLQPTCQPPSGPDTKAKGNKKTHTAQKISHAMPKAWAWDGLGHRQQWTNKLSRESNRSMFKIWISGKAEYGVIQIYVSYVWRCMKYAPSVHVKDNPKSSRHKKWRYPSKANIKSAGASINVLGQTLTLTHHEDRSCTEADFN